MTKAKPAKRPERTGATRVGKDEMNLAEFPIAILAHRAPEGVKTLRFRDQHGQLTVTGSDALGLPTAIDADVIVGLLELTKKRNNFTEQTVHFTRYELIRLIGWANVGTSYERIEESLNRWAGVLLMYDSCLWDNRSKSYVSKTFHIIESIILAEGRMKASKDGSQASLPVSSFTWSKDFVQSCKDNNLKDLDTELYFSLKLPTSKQLFRFLDKRFYRSPELELDLAEVAFERVGLSRGYKGNAGKIKEKLGDAIEELESRGFLKPLGRDERYFKTRDGWRIRLVDGKGVMPAMPLLPPPPLAAEPPPLVTELVDRGVSRTVAADLVKHHPAEAIRAKIEVFDWLAGKHDKRVGNNPPGYLVKSIADDYKAPKGFVPKAELDRQAEAKQQAERGAAEGRRRKQSDEARDQAERKAIAAYWESLTPRQQADLDAACDALADAETLAGEKGRYQDTFRLVRRRTYIRQLLESRGTAEA
jgi:Replication initiator protein A